MVYSYLLNWVLNDFLKYLLVIENIKLVELFFKNKFEKEVSENLGSK